MRTMTWKPYRVLQRLRVRSHRLPRALGAPRARQRGGFVVRGRGARRMELGFCHLGAGIAEDMYSGITTNCSCHISPTVKTGGKLLGCSASFLLYSRLTQTRSSIFLALNTSSTHQAADSACAWSQMCSTSALRPPPPFCPAQKEGC